MKRIIGLALVTAMFSCSTNMEKGETMSQSSEESISSEQESAIDSTDEVQGASNTQSTQEGNSNADAIPGDGSYRFEMAFAEKQGQSLGEKVTVNIKGQSVEVIYEGDGNLDVAKGTVLEKGTIVKHKSGVWIIAQSDQDAQLDEIGGCSGGPKVIDFKNKKYLTC